MDKFDLQAAAGPQHYGIGLKELWDVDPERHVPGRILHNVGWPLGRMFSPGMGSFLYHQENNQVALGIIVDLAYKNPHLSPFDELQRLKHHPLFADVLEGGRRVAYGARAIIKGGLQALPKLSVPGALIVGDDAGFLNMLKIKGTHTAMKSGMLAAESVFDALGRGEAGTELDDFRARVDGSWLGKELRSVRNVGPALHKFGTLFGMAYTFLDQKIARGYMPFTLTDPVADHDKLVPAHEATKIDYPKPDGVLVLRQAVLRVPIEHQPRGRPALPPDTGRRRVADPRQPAAIRRTSATLLPGRRLRSGRGERPTALPDQRPELRALQDVRHQGSGAEH